MQTTPYCPCQLTAKLCHHQMYFLFGCHPTAQREKRGNNTTNNNKTAPLYGIAMYSVPQWVPGAREVRVACTDYSQDIVTPTLNGPGSGPTIKRDPLCTFFSSSKVAGYTARMMPHFYSSISGGHTAIHDQINPSQEAQAGALGKGEGQVRICTGSRFVVAGLQCQ